MQIIEVPAEPKAPKVLRVAAYARVSADKNAAFHSLESQTDYYNNYIQAHPDWELTAIYSDNAVSGTKEDRPEFQRMLADCRARKIDLIVTKSITRFARNTVVLLEAIRELKKLDIDVYFEKEHMHSISAEGELLLTLLALYAEEEARSASENQKWRIKKKFEQGQTTQGKLLGYRLKNSVLTVVPEEAEIVKRIFRDYLSGKSLGGIAKSLNRDHISPVYSDVWNHSSIYTILTNEKYTGNMILQKTYVPDFRTKRQIVNNGQVPKYHVSHSHEAIISEEDFLLAQQKLQYNRENPIIPKGKPHLFSGLIKCGQCGSSYVRRNRGKGKYKRPVWICHRFSDMGKDVCASQAVPENILIEKTCELLNVSELTREVITEQIERIEVPEPNHMVYVLKDGTPVDVLWRHHSRRESWTPEMKDAARQRAIAQRRKELKE